MRLAHQVFHPGDDGQQPVYRQGLIAGGVEVETGGDPISFEFIDELLEARGSVLLSLYGFFYVSGSFAFQKTEESISVAVKATAASREAVS